MNIAIFFKKYKLPHHLTGNQKALIIEPVRVIRNKCTVQYRKSRNKSNKQAVLKR
jgi:hypothetical protein